MMTLRTVILLSMLIVPITSTYSKPFYEWDVNDPEAVKKIETYKTNTKKAEQNIKELRTDIKILNERLKFVEKEKEKIEEENKNNKTAEKIVSVQEEHEQYIAEKENKLNQKRELIKVKELKYFTDLVYPQQEFKLIDGKIIKQDSKEYKSRFHIAVVGRQRTGKGSLINALRGINAIKAKGPDRKDKVNDIRGGTKEPTPYEHRSLNITIWDFPPYSDENPPHVFALKYGLKYFDLFIVTQIEAIFKHDRDMVNQIIFFRLPFVVVRSKFDESVYQTFMNENISNGKMETSTAWELLNKGDDVIDNAYKSLNNRIIKEQEKYDFPKIFQVCANTLTEDVFDMKALRKEIQMQAISSWGKQLTENDVAKKETLEKLKENEHIFKY